MKKFFAFAMALVSMAAVMTSCNNDDAAFIEQKAPAPAPQPKEDIDKFDGNLYFAATPMQLDLFNNIYIVNAGGESFEVNLETLQETSVIPNAKAKQIADFLAENGKDSMKLFCYKLPAAVKSIAEVSATAKISVKDGIEMPEEFNFIAGMTDKEGRGKLKQSVGVSAKDTDNYLNIVNNTDFTL